MRANVPVAVVVQTVNNPLTIPIYYTMAYHVGEVMLGRPAKYENRIGEKIQKLDETEGIRAKLRMLAGELAMVAVPLMLGCTVIGVVVSIAGYGLIYAIWPEEVGKKEEIDRG
jgi:uncharacterized protein (DUF2062 family)